jgi:5S rRNA maturation endonuclease (ribonuclease M5)
VTGPLFDTLGQPVATLEEFLAAATAIDCDPEEVKDGSGVWSLRCPHPGHVDNHPSATLRAGTKGAPYLLHCFVCTPAKDQKGNWLREAVEAVSQGTMKPPAEDTGDAKPGKRRSGPSGRPVAFYDYTDTAGTLVARKTRYLKDDGGKDFGWSRPVGDAWAGGLGRGGSVDLLPMYGLASLAQPGPVFVVEGEKDADLLHSLGLAAVTAGCGAQKDPAAVKLPRDMEPLRGRDVIVVADRDDPGAAYAWAWRDRLDGIATKVTLARAAVDKPGADITDHLEAGHDLAALDFGPLPEPTPVEDDHSSRRVVLTSAASIAPKRVRWLWAGRVAVGTLALLAGREGLGKSTITYWVVAQITRGTLPGEDHGRPRSVIICATEDAWAEVIVPRLIAAGADRSRVYRVEVETSLDVTAELSLPRDIAGLAVEARKVDAALLVLDPLMSRLSSTLDTHRDAEVRQALEPLTKMLSGSRMAAIGLMHFNKSGGDDPLTSVMGSRGFTAVARSVSTVIRDPDDDTGARRLFGTPKNNLGPTDLPMLAFTITGHPVPTDEGDCWTSVIAWAGEVEGTVEDALRRASGNPGERTAVQEASDWLTDYLRSQGLSADSATVKKAGSAAGHSHNALHRARERLGITTESVGFPRRTVWTLPDDSHPTVVPTPGETHTTRTTGTTAASHPSRPSRPSRVEPHARETTGLLTDLLSPCSLCELPTVTDPCTDCRRATPPGATPPMKETA